MRRAERKSCPIPVSTLGSVEPWRQIDWSEKQKILQDLESLQPDSAVLKILLFGPIGAGKSCFINSVQRSLLGRNAIIALENTAQCGVSFTRSIRSHRMKKRGGGHYPFVLTDITGLEVDEGAGIRTDDLISALEGHISDGYTFNPLIPITADHPKYKSSPTARDKVHCLVNIIPADSISRMDQRVFEKMMMVRNKALELNIPHVVVLTKVDNVCPLVNQDLRKIYQSSKIKNKVHECSKILGISLNSIYPLKNYHMEITQDSNVDVLILSALRDFVMTNIGKRSSTLSFVSSTEMVTKMVENLLKPSHPSAQHQGKLCKPWRPIEWRDKEELLQCFEEFSSHFSCLKILLYGPVGAGKSSFINSVQKSLLGHNAMTALENTTQSGKSFTRSIKTHRLKRYKGGYYPFAFCDITGLEATANRGIRPDDIMKALDGHIKDGYIFHPGASITMSNLKYNHSPKPCDKVHCLVSILPADAISQMENSLIDKMMMVHGKASELKIPQVIVLTKADQACQMVSEDLTTIFHSTKIREKVQESSDKLRIPLNNIYPVKNYHMEVTQNDHIELLILTALKDIVTFAGDYVIYEMNDS